MITFKQFLTDAVRFKNKNQQLAELEASVERMLQIDPRRFGKSLIKHPGANASIDSHQSDEWLIIKVFVNLNSETDKHDDFERSMVLKFLETKIPKLFANEKLISSRSNISNITDQWAFVLNFEQAK